MDSTFNASQADVASNVNPNLQISSLLCLQPDKRHVELRVVIFKKPSACEP